MDLSISLLTTISSFILVLFVFSKNPKSATNIYFSLLIFFIGLYPIFNFLALHSTSSNDALFWAKFIIFSAVPVGPLFYLFVKTFPEVKSQVSLKIQLALGIWALINIVLGFLGFIFSDVMIISGQPHIQPGNLVPLFGLLQITTILAGSWTLFKKYRQATGFFKLQLRYIAYGIVISFGLTLLSTLILPLIFNINFLIPVSPIFLQVAGVSIAYSIVKHKLLDIRMVLARAVSFSSLVGLFGFLYALMFGMVTAFFANTALTVKTIAVSTVLALFMAFTFQPLRRILEKITDKIFYKDRYETSKLLYDLTLIMASTLRLEDLTHRFLEELLMQMRVTKGAFILVEEERIYDVAYQGYTKNPEFDESQVRQILEGEKMLVADDLTEGILKNILREMDITLVVPLHTEGEDIGLLALGGRLSGEIYNGEDIRVLEILAPETAVAIQNAKAFEEIQRFNITLQEEITLATQQLRVANNKLQELDKLKDDFVSIASHELRTPMTAVRSYAWMALHRSDVPLSDKLKKYLERTLISTERLINLINDMLNISRIESGRVEIVPKIFDMHEFVSDVIIEVGIKAKEKKLQLVVANNLIPKVFADPDKVHQILLNLIGNAIKFTPENGTVKVDFFSDGKTLEVLIEDNGVGIAAENLSSLFTKFGRLDDSYTAAVSSGGTGLGLYICKNLVELMGGKIWAKSDGVGKGSVFTFSLPIASSDTLANAKNYTRLVSGGAKVLEPVAL